MAIYRDVAGFDALRTAAFGAIGAAYAAIGTPLTKPAVVVSFINNCTGDVVVSTDGVTDMLYVPGGFGQVFDIRTNGPNSTDYMFPIGTQFYVKDGAVATSAGNFYIEAVVVTSG